MKNTLTIGPDLELYAIAIIRALQILGRTQYVTVLHALTSTGFQAGGLIKLMEQYFPETIVEALPVREKPEDFEDTVKTMNRVLEVGFRTIILNLEAPAKGLKTIAQAANEAGLTNGEYVWIMYGDFNQVLLDGVDNDPDVQKLLKGSLWLTASEEWLFGNDPTLLTGWNNIDNDFVSKLKASYPEDGLGGAAFSDLSLSDFTENLPELGSALMYDAVMSAGENMEELARPAFILYILSS